ncbi:hypothetical protein A249_12866, partial [Pseudomonas syringae pv. actinidiae ICMP 18804]
HFAQAEAAKPAATLHQLMGGIQQGSAGLLFLFGAGQHGSNVSWNRRQHFSKCALPASKGFSGKRSGQRDSISTGLWLEFIFKSNPRRVCQSNIHVAFSAPGSERCFLESHA